MNRPDPEPSSTDDTALAAARWRRIAEVAYAKAEQRGFQGNRDVEDWLDAEREVDLAGDPAPVIARKTTARRRSAESTASAGTVAPASVTSAPAPQRRAARKAPADRAASGEAAKRKPA